MHENSAKKISSRNNKSSAWNTLQSASCCFIHSTNICWIPIMLDSITDSVDMNLGKFQQRVEGRGVWRAIVHGKESDMTQWLNITTIYYVPHITLGTTWTIAISSLPSEDLRPQFSHSVVSDSLWPHESQHARLPCPSPTPGAYSNSCPLIQSCHPALSSSVVPFSSHLQSVCILEEIFQPTRCNHKSWL